HGVAAGRVLEDEAVGALGHTDLGGAVGGQHLDQLDAAGGLERHRFAGQAEGHGGGHAGEVGPHAVGPTEARGPAQLRRDAGDAVGGGPGEAVVADGDVHRGGQLVDDQRGVEAVLDDVDAELLDGGG